MHRFFISNFQKNDNLSISLEQIRHQLKNVLRLRKDDLIEVFDETRCEYSIKILDDDCGFGKIISEKIRQFEIYPEVILCQAFIKNDRFELILEKISELGVTQIIPMISERVQGRSKLKAENPKHVRWQKIIKEAVEQSGGNIMPKLEPFYTLKDLLELFKEDEKIIFYEKSEVLKEGYGIQDLRPCLIKLASKTGKHKINKIVIFIGPVGGFSLSEILMAKDYGCNIVSLGDRVLKAETAAISSVSVIRYQFQGFISGKNRS